LQLLLFTFFFGIGFDITGSAIRRSGSKVPVTAHNPIDIGLFSFAALTAASSAAGLEPRSAVAQLFSCLQALLIVGFTGCSGLFRVTGSGGKRVCIEILESRAWKIRVGESNTRLN
jgi:hypothetical protein